MMPFLPYSCRKKEGANAKVVHFAAAKANTIIRESPVLMGVYEAAPADCPEGSFWVKKNVSLVNCSDGTEFRFVPLQKIDGFPYQGALKLEAIGNPRPPGTDDPAPCTS